MKTTVKNNNLHTGKEETFVIDLKFLLTFENGQTVLADDNSYITITTYEKMFESKLWTVIPM